MKYIGKLFGQIGRTRGYFDTGKTSDDWDALEARAERAEAELAAEREKVRELRECLSNLLDEQNGAPLERRRLQWQATMDEARAALDAAIQEDPK